MAMFDAGWLRGIRHVPSPNFNARPSDMPVDMLVIHSISLPPRQYGGSFIEDFFCNRLDCAVHPYFSEIDGLQVSAHFLIRRDGEIVQFVSCDDRAWHAGQSAWCGRENCNDFSVGIELEGCDDEAFTAVQYRQLARLCRDMMTAYPLISTDRIVGHSDIAPGRKTDPGTAFDWNRLHQSLREEGQES